MTKLVTLRVRVPADDAARVSDVAKSLTEMLEGKGTENLPAVDGEASDLGGPTRGPRIHWAAADVLQGEDRAVPTPARARGRGRKTT